MGKIQIIEELFLYLLYFSFLLLPLAFLLTIKSRNWISFLMACYGLLFFLLNYFYDELPKEYKKVYFPLYTYLEYILFATLLWANITNKKIKQFIVISSIGFGIFQIVYFLTTSLKRLDTVPIGIETILIFLFIILFFYNFFQNSLTENIYSNYCFWISVGILIYLGGSFFLNILANHVPNIIDYWYLTYIAETFKNILFSLSIFILAKTKFNSIKEKTSEYNNKKLDLI